MPGNQESAALTIVAPIVVDNPGARPLRPTCTGSGGKTDENSRGKKFKRL